MMKRSDINILIVEDDKSFGKVLKEALARTGMSVKHSTSPIEALNHCKMQSIHLAIIDCMLPKMNGIDLSCEIRKTQFDQNPIILISGIFKERAFENESLTKTGAISFLKKPFELKDLEELVLKSLSGLLEGERWSLKSLLARRLRSIRDRMKVIESLESISGLDIPIVFSILSDARVSGHLNLSTEDGQIYGVTFSKGKISSFDSENAESIILDQLKQSHYLSEEDWNEFQSLGEKRSIINKLINKGYVSPHAIEDAKGIQIRREMADLIALPKLQLSFVLDDTIDVNEGVEFLDCYSFIQPKFSEIANRAFFYDLYQDYMDSPIRLNDPDEKMQYIWDLEVMSKIQELRRKVEESLSISEIISSSEADEVDVFLAIHFLFVNRAILFDDLQKTRNAEAFLERVRKLKRDLKSLNPIEIFMYFGASDKVAISEVQKIYKTFSETNHPDRVKDESPEVKEISKELYELVSAAYEKLTDEVQRASLFSAMKEKNDDIQATAAGLAEKGLDLLRKGQNQPAFEAFSQAYAIASSPRMFCLKVWGEMKVKASTTSSSRLMEILQKLEVMTADDRRDPYYWMALGLVKKALGAPTAASYFEKALVLDQGFVEARRELNSIQMQMAQTKSSKTMDFLKGDITELVSQIFRKKSG